MVQRVVRFALALALILIGPAAQARPVMVEMFTSLACSSCPPADALLRQLAKNPDILPLSFNVTYWNSLGWTDPYGLQATNARQAWYAGVLNTGDVYTPEAVVDGRSAMVGSDKTKIVSAIAAAKAKPAGDTSITISDGPRLKLAIGGGPGRGEIWLFGFDASHTTAVGGGENGGVTITETNLVRSVTNLGAWNGEEARVSMQKPAGEHMAVVLQAPSGAILGVAME